MYFLWFIYNSVKQLPYSLELLNIKKRKKQWNNADQTNLVKSTIILMFLNNLLKLADFKIAINELIVYNFAKCLTHIHCSFATYTSNTCLSKLFCGTLNISMVKLYIIHWFMFSIT